MKSDKKFRNSSQVAAYWRPQEQIWLFGAWRGAEFEDRSRPSVFTTELWLQSPVIASEDADRTATATAVMMSAITIFCSPL